jgi:hypothetical protein
METVGGLQYLACRDLSDSFSTLAHTTLTNKRAGKINAIQPWKCFIFPRFIIGRGIAKYGIGIASYVCIIYGWWLVDVGKKRQIVGCVCVGGNKRGKYVRCADANRP